MINNSNKVIGVDVVLLHATEFIIEFKTLFDSIADTPDPTCITVGN
jgi:hypothetical protein